jgi:hypothetical protein
MKIPFFKVALLFGIAAGTACFFYLVLLYAFGANPFGRFKYIYLGLYAAFFGGALWYYRFRQNNGQLSTGRAIGLGLLLNISASTLYGLLLYFWMLIPSLTVIERHQGDLEQLQLNNISFIQEQMKTSQKMEDLESYENLGDQKKDIEQALETLKQQPLTAGVLAVDQALGLIFTGTFLAFLTALMFKSR